METFKLKAIILNLLHPTNGRPIQQWRFESASVIRIGRGDDNEVTIADPQVSRRHAELRFDGGVWELCSLGRNGTVYEGKRINRRSLPGSAVFQLGPGGPTIECRHDEAMIAEAKTTDCSALDLGAALAIDEQRRDAELNQIVETPFFQKLQRTVGDLRRNRPDAGKAKN